MLAVAGWEKVKHMLHTRPRCDVTIWIVVSCGVVRSFADLDVLHDAILAHKNKTLAPWISERILWPRVIHKHAECFCELASCVREKGDDRTMHFLVFCPCLHHCSIIDTVYQHLVNAFCFQLLLLLQVSRNLLR